MPKKVEEKLRREGRKKGFTGNRLKAYIYGTMTKLGLMKRNKTVSKSKLQRSK